MTEEPLVKELDELMQRLEAVLSDLRKLQAEVSRMYVRGEIACNTEVTNVTRSP